MANSLTFESRYSARYQDILSKVAVADIIATTRLESELTFGQTIDRFKLDMSNIEIRDEVRTETDRTSDDVSDTTEQLSINQSKYAGVRLHDWDKLQKRQGVAEEMAKQIAIKMRTNYDGSVLNETQNAFDTFAGGDIAGTAGAPIDFTTTNIPLIVTQAPAKLRANNIDEMNMVMIVDPLMTARIEQFLIGKSVDMASSVFKNGYVGKITRNMDVNESNSLTYKVSLGMATNPTANDTVTIGGVTFKFVASPSAAGDIDIGSDAAGSMANLILALNGTGTPGSTTYTEISTANRKKLKNTLRLTATNNTTAIGIECVGSGRVVVSETLTAAGDVFSTGYIESYVGKKKSVDVVRQQDVKPDVTRHALRPRIAYMWTDMLWGKKTFDDGKQRFLNLKIQA